MQLEHRHEDDRDDDECVDAGSGSVMALDPVAHQCPERWWTSAAIATPLKDTWVTMLGIRRLVRHTNVASTIPSTNSPANCSGSAWARAKSAALSATPKITLAREPPQRPPSLNARKITPRKSHSSIIGANSTVITISKTRPIRNT